MEQLFSSVLAYAASAFIGAISGAIVSYMSAKKATNEALQVLLWREIKNIYDDSKRNNGLTIEERKHLDAVYSAYHKRGGNGTGTRMYKDAMESPILD